MSVSRFLLSRHTPPQTTPHLSWKLMLGAIGTTALCIMTTKTVAAQQSPQGWSDTAELTMVFTAGNAQATTLGLRNELIGDRDTSRVSLEMGALRAKSTQTTRVATGRSPLDFQVLETSETILTAEHYFTRGRYNRNLQGETFWHIGGGWDRNTFAGFNNRYTGNGGIGQTWIDNDVTVFKTTYGISYTIQQDIAALPNSNDGFVGIRLSYEFDRQVTPTTEFTSSIVADENLETTTDFRADLINAISVSVSSLLALKVSWQLLYDHLPSHEAVPLMSSKGALTNHIVLTPLNPVDQIVTFALVARF
ncbi:MAG: hypothetical protein CL484_00145 [Acidobacteria bacterium]|nr:hypothetical protein [Acidobacteriota bacterium]